MATNLIWSQAQSVAHGMVWGRPHQYPQFDTQTITASIFLYVRFQKMAHILQKRAHFLQEIAQFLVPEIGTFFGPRNGNLLLCLKRKDPEMGTEYVLISGTRKLWFWMSSVREIYDSKQTHKPCPQGLLLPSPYELQHRPMPWGAPRVLKSPPHLSLPKQSLNKHW